jgi:hypothetical protein
MSQFVIEVELNSSMVIYILPLGIVVNYQNCKL